MVTRSYAFLFAFLLVCKLTSFFQAHKLANGVIVKSNQKTSILKQDFKTIQKKYQKYGALNSYSAKNQFFVEATSEKSRDSLTRILGRPEMNFGETTGLWTASFEAMKALEAKGLVKWVGIFKPHQKFLASSHPNPKKPFNTIIRLQEEASLKFTITLSNRLLNSKNEVDKFSDYLKNKINAAQSIYMIEIQTYALPNGQPSPFMTLVLHPNNPFSDENEVFGLYDSIFKHIASEIDVLSIEKTVLLKLFNKSSNSILQQGARPITSGLGPLKSSLAHRNDIQGQNQVVCVADTGLDVSNCMFYDPVYPKIEIGMINNDHRKVIAYYNVTSSGKTSDGLDSVHGHGSHVSGSVAGFVPESENNTLATEYSGGAPKAKLVMLDINLEKTGEMIVPPDFNTAGFFEIAHKAGAKIFTNSWGNGVKFSCQFDCVCSSGGTIMSNELCRATYNRDCCRVHTVYNAQAVSLDRWLFEHPDTVVLFAAGNDGIMTSNSTIASPSLAKNSLSVGASQTENSNQILANAYEDIESIVKKNSITESWCCSHTLDAVKAYCCRSFMNSSTIAHPEWFNHQNLAEFSSRGPAVDDLDPKPEIYNYRFKPDVAAPGKKVISTHSWGYENNGPHCSSQFPAGNNSATLATMSGTSMATPILAGNVALIRDYYSRNLKTLLLVEADPSAPEPSGVLLKGLTIHSAQPMKGIVQLDGANRIASLQHTRPGPNPLYGHGVPDLSFIMQFPNEQKAGNQPAVDIKIENLKFYEKAIFKDHVYRINLSNKLENSGKFDQFFKATLAWYDSPSASLSVTSENILNNDLDLVVEIPSRNKVFFGNGFDGDKVNTVETVFIAESELLSLNLRPDEEIIVRVRGRRILDDRVPFSVIVSSTFAMRQPDSKSAASSLFSFATIALMILALFL